MLIRMIAIGATAALTLMAQPALAQTETRRDAGVCNPRGDAWVRFRAGDAEDRRCVIERLSDFRLGLFVGSAPDDTAQSKRVADPDLSPGAKLIQVQAHARTLSEYYANRSERQQTFLDSGAAVTGAGTLGYAFSAPAGALTQSYWGYGALVPIILVQFNANEPTRDLFFAGQIGADLISDRYALVNGRYNLLQGATPQQSPFGQACADIETRLSRIEAWTAGDDKLAVLPAATAAAERCRALSRGWTATNTLQATAGTWMQSLAESYAYDLIRLDGMLSERDVQLRTSPSEALTMLVSTPLRALDTLISGENAQKALDSIATQQSLAGISLRLSEVVLPAAPATIDTPLTLSPTVDARASATTRAETRQTIAWLRTTVAQLEDARGAYNERTRWAIELEKAAISTNLDFSYDLTAKRVQVVLRAPGAEAPAATTAGA